RIGGAEDCSRIGKIEPPGIKIGAELAPWQGRGNCCAGTRARRPWRNSRRHAVVAQEIKEDFSSTHLLGHIGGVLLRTIALQVQAHIPRELLRLLPIELISPRALD